MKRMTRQKGLEGRIGLARLKPRLLCALLVVAASATLPAADAGFTLGTPGVARIRDTTAESGNAWLAKNTAYAAMGIVAPVTGTTGASAISAQTVAGAERVILAANESGFAVERTKPEYYLGDRIEPPDGVDWPATYEKFLADYPKGDSGLLFDTTGEAVYVTEGGTRRISWVLASGKTTDMTYITAASCAGRPRRIYWTDDPYNGPGIDLSGKFVRFFGSADLITPQYGVYTNEAAGIQQVISNKVVRGLVVDKSANMLYAYAGPNADLQGQVVMAYYDTGTYERMLHVQAVEICRPVVNIMKGEIGRALKPDGRGYDTSGLRARPTAVSPTDNRGEYLYQHKGQYSYSPKSGNVYPLRPTVDCRWNAEIYWMETDEMEVQWPFELDHYECDWPDDATVFVRGDVNGDTGRDIYIPTHYAATLMDYQEPEGHAVAPTADGTFTTKGEGHSLLRLTADDNIWFVPIRSILRSNTDYFTLTASEVPVGREMKLRGGVLAGTAGDFSPTCDAGAPGYIYEAASARIWNPNIYAKPAADTGTGVSTNAIGSTSGETTTNTYASVIYAVTANAENPEVEVWWNTTIQEEGMSEKLTIPTLPQVYEVRWPEPGENPEIVIASQQGSGANSVYAHNAALELVDEESSAELASRAYFGAEGGTVMFWMHGFDEPQPDGSGDTPSAILTLKGKDTVVALDWSDLTNVTLKVNGKVAATRRFLSPDPYDWHHVAVAFTTTNATLYVDGYAHELAEGSALSPLCGAVVSGTLGAGNGFRARPDVSVGELLFWSSEKDGYEVAEEIYATHTGQATGLTGCYSFIEGSDLGVTGSDTRTFTEKILGIRYDAHNCLLDEIGPPALDAAVLTADSGTTPKVYVQNDPSAVGYNPNEEHAFVQAGSGGYVVWAVRGDLNTDDSSRPGVLVEYAKNGAKRMQWYDVSVTNEYFPKLAADCYAGKALPGPHPLDLFDDPWKPETYWEEAVADSPAHRDRKGQLWAKSAGDLHIHNYYPMQEGFAFPQIATNEWPAVGASVPWLSLLDGTNAAANVLTAAPAAWHWRVDWPEEVPEIEIGRTLTTAASGLPEVWNAKSVGVLYPATDEAREKTAILFDPTVAQTAGFSSDTYASVAAAIADLGIKQGAGGNATLKKGKWTFDGLPPSISSRFYLDTTADLGSCLKLVGEQEDNTGGVSLLNVNVLNETERAALSTVLDDYASDAGKAAWKAAIAELATAPVRPSQHRVLSDAEDIIDYQPRDHYALFTMGATNYVTLIENDATNELMNVAAGDPINMHVLKVVPKYYVGRVVTREDPLNLLSQQLSVVYAESFAGKPEDYVFDWAKRTPPTDGTVPTDFTSYWAVGGVTNLTRFVIGGQGDTLANMVNTYYAMRYRAKEGTAAYEAMGDAWSAWTDPPALAEGWVQRVLNNVTPFAQRMRDLAENEAETAVTMIKQAGAPYTGDVALNQDNLKNVGLIQLYETILSKAESMSLQLGINDADANKQLQLAVARLADLYNVLGDEAYTDALNPTIGFGANFDTTEKTGFELDYGALSSALFCFDNQVPTLLDEELALLRGRTQENAPSTHLGPYYNRLVWNFTRGMNAGEVAYAVNYDISGNRKGVIDYSQAAEQYPQGHGDAYGHYLSALSGYYRLLRNPYFSWGEPAMGEMVVADAVVNVDYYDEAQFAKAAENVAKVALEVVDRTARKAYRDNGGATGAGYIDSDTKRNFGYGEWGSRGGFGALCNWAVANSILGEEPLSGLYWRYKFTGGDSTITTFDIADDDAPDLKRNGTWTVEFQVVADPDATIPDDNASLAILGDDEHAFGFDLTKENKLVFSSARMVGTAATNTIYHFSYTNASITASTSYRTLAATNKVEGVTVENEFGTGLGGAEILECIFFGDGAVPTAFPEGYDVAAQLATKNPAAPDWSGEGWLYSKAGEEGASAYIYDEEVTTYSLESAAEEVEIATLAPGANYLVALRSSGGSPRVSVFDASGHLVADVEDGITLGGDVSVTWAALGVDFTGELGELRVWEGVRRSNEQLLAKREYVSSVSDGLALYLRTISRTADVAQLTDEKNTAVLWDVTSGQWVEERESGIAIDFNDEGLKRIDRSTVGELASLANLVPQIQKKVDQMDAGLNPLGLASGAIPFDLDPYGGGESEGTYKTHYEQISARAKTALGNARKSLEKAQESANRMRLLYEAELEQEEMLSTAELEFKNKLIEYFGYPYEGDIGPSGTYAQGYDGPDLIHYAWMVPSEYGCSAPEDTLEATVSYYSMKAKDDWLPNLVEYNNPDDDKTFTFVKSATGIILKPDSVTGKRRAQGKIQDAMADFLRAYGSYKRSIDDYQYAVDQFAYDLNAVRSEAVRGAILKAVKEANYIIDSVEAVSEAALKMGINAVESIMKLTAEQQDLVLDAAPEIVGAGMTVNTDPSAMVAAAMAPAAIATRVSLNGTLLAAKNSLVSIDAADIIREAVEETLELASGYFDDIDDWYTRLRSAADDEYSAACAVGSAYKNLVVAQKAVETVVAEAERVIDERTLKRQQSVDSLTKARYNEMFFRIQRNAALSRYSSMFDLAQKYVYLAAQAYDYETGLLSSDEKSGEEFIAEIVGARTLGEFASDGEPMVTSGNGDGGLSDILARLDANWLVLKPRLGINNPQPYATWFSLRHELFRIYSDERGDKAWRTALEKAKVADLNALPAFQHYCQPLAGSTAEVEPGFVIEFPSSIVYGLNFFGNETAGGDSPLDPTWYATHISAAGVHFEGYDASNLAKTPTCYLVPVGEDRMRAVGDHERVLSWHVVDQTIPAPYAIGSTELDDPDWTPLYNGATGGNDLGARIRKHPSFRAYYDEKGKSPADSELDCTRLVGRSAWNTRWLLIIPAGQMNANRDDALDAFLNSVSDIKLGLKTYSASGN